LQQHPTGTTHRGTYVKSKRMERKGAGQHTQIHSQTNANQKRSFIYLATTGADDS